MDHKYQALLAVSEAIVAHRDLSALFHELAGRLHQVVRFDYLGLVLHEATSNTLRIRFLEGPEPTPLPYPPVLPLEEEPAGWVWETRQAWMFSNVPEEKRWPRAVERAKRYGVRSSCHLPLTTARQRLGILVFACKQPFAYETADLGFLQLVANQVAVAIENAIAFQEIEALQVPLGDLQSAVTQAPEPIAAAVTLAEAEREHILGALRETGWVVAGSKGAASRLGMKRSTLQEKMRKLGIPRPQ